MNDESHDLGDRLRRLATWADAVPEPHRRLAAVYVDRLAVALARLVGEHADDPLVAALTTEVEQ